MESTLTLNPAGALPVLPDSAPAAVRQPPVLSAAPPRPAFRIRAGYVVLGLVLLVPLVAALGIASYFQLGSATRALRSSVMDSVPGTWDKRFAVNVGGLTLGLVRYGSQFFKIPPEPKAALAALHGAEVGVYRLEETPSETEFAKLFVTADRSMRRRGWERVVGVANRGQFVAVYMPHKLTSLRRMACSVAVFNGHDLVVVSARGNLEPLLALAREHLPADMRQALEPLSAGL